MTEDVLWRRDAGGLGQMIYQRAAEFRPGRPLLDRPRKVGIVGRDGGCPNCFFPSGLRQNSRAGNEEKKGERREKP
jgi:hypothetical protein